MERPDTQHVDSSTPSTVRLTGAQNTEVWSIGRQVRNLLTRKGVRSHAHQSAQIQLPVRENRPLKMSNMTGHSRGTSEREEAQALLNNTDGEEDYLDNNNRTNIRSGGSSSSSTLAEYQTDLGDGHDEDSEAARDVRKAVAPDQFLEGFETTKWEIWAYYGFYIGNTGLTLATFAPMAMQNLMSLAAGEKGTLRFLGRDRTIDSIALLASAISFSLQILVFLILGSLADFGSWRSSILIVQSLIGIAVGFVWLDIHRPQQWKLAVAMFIVGLVAFQTSLAYYFAAFPALARNTPELRKKAEDLNAGFIELKEYEECDSTARNHIANTSLWIGAAGGTALIALMLGILYAVDATADTESNSWGLSLIIGVGSAAWLVFAVPWFILEKRRPGRPVPPGMNIFTAGLWQVYNAGSQIKKLSQSLAYLIAFFVVGESLGTSIGVIGILQNEVAGYDITQLSQFIMMSYVAAAFGVWICVKIQQRYAFTTKTMLCGTVVCIIAMNLWGIVGIWTDAFGYHQIWEFWIFNFWFGFCVSPWYSFSQTMISEITPRGKDFLFFSLFNVIGKASSFIGPLVSSTIIDADPHHNSWMPFYFLTVLSIVGLMIIIFFVDLDKSRREQQRFLEIERIEIEKMADNLVQKHP